MSTNSSYVITVDPVEERPTSSDISVAVEEVIEDMHKHRMQMEKTIREDLQHTENADGQYTMKLRERRLFVDIAFVMLLILGALMVAYVYALFVVVEGEVRKQDIINVVEDVTKRKMEINGRITFEAFPFPKFRVDGVKMFNSMDEESGTFAEVKTFQLEPSIFYLLVGNIKVSELTLSGVSVNVENYIGKEPNWKMGGDDVDFKLTSILGFSKKYFNFDKLIIDNLKTHFYSGYKDRPIMRTLSLQKVVLDAGLGDEQYRISGNFYAQKADITFGYDLNISEIQDEGSDALNAVLKVSTQTSDIVFDGSVNYFKNNPVYSGELTGTLDDSLQYMRKYISSDNTLLSNALAGLLIGEGTKASGKFKLDKNVFSIRKLVVEDESIEGAADVDVAFGQVLTLKTNLNYQKLDLDELIKQSAEAEILSRKEIAGGKSFLDTDERVNVTDIGLPDDMDMVLRAKIDQIIYKEKKMKGLRLDMSAGDITAIRAIEIVSFPGGSYMKGGGKIYKTEDGPKFKGKIGVKVKSGPDLLKWLGYQSQYNIQKGVLKDLEVNANVIITREEMLLSKIALKVDGSNLNGRVSIEKKNNFIVKSSLIIGELDIDKYYKERDASVKDLNAEYVMFEFLRYIDNMFDSFALALNVKKVIFEEQVYENFSTVASFGGGISELAGVKFNVGGEPIRGSIRLDNRQLNPEIDLIFDINKMDIKTLLGFVIEDLGVYDPNQNPYTTPFVFDFTKFNIIRGTIRLNIKDVVVDEEDDIHFERVRLDLNLLKDLIKLERFSAQGFGGNIRVQGQLETGSRVLGHFNYYLTNVYVKKILEQLFSIESIEGRINSNGQIAVSGNTFRQWIRTMSGKGEAVSRGITLYGFDSGFLLKSLPKTRKSIRHVRFIVHKALTSGSTEVNFAQATYNFFQGEIVFVKHTLNHDLMRNAILSGSMNLIKWFIDSEFSFMLQGNGQASYPMKARIYGPLSSPRVTWDEKSIVKRWEDSKF